MTLGAQDRPAIHQCPLVAGRILIHVLAVVQRQDVGFHAPGGDAFHAAVVVTIVATHFSRDRRDDDRPGQLGVGIGI